MADNSRLNELPVYTARLKDFVSKTDPECRKAPVFAGTLIPNFQPTIFLNALWVVCRKARISNFQHPSIGTNFGRNPYLEF